VGAFLKMVLLPKGDKELGRGQTMNFRVTTYKEIADKKAKWEEDFLEKLNELVDEMDKDDAARARDEELTKQEWKEYVGDDPELEPLIREAPKTTQRHIDEIGEQKIIELLKKAREVKNQEEDLVPLVPPSVEKVTEERLQELLKQRNKFKGFKLTAWKMNGDAAPVSNEMGKLISGEYGIAEYTAPWVVPLNKIRSIAISCEFINLKSKAKFIFVTHVFLTNNGWFKATIDGNAWFAHQLLDQKYLKQVQDKIPSHINSAADVSFVKSADAHFITEGDGKGLWIMLTYGFPKNIKLHIPNPHLGQNVIDCNENGTSLQLENEGASLVFVKATKRGSTCDREEICKSITVNLTSLNLKTGGLVSGDFNGSLWGGTNEEKSCKSSDQYKVSGKFSLSVVAQSDFTNITIPKKN
jgi:hypothetical protein